MEVLTEADWLRFDDMVDSAEPWSFSQETTSIVFRGESVSYTIDFAKGMRSDYPLIHRSESKIAKSS